MPGDVEQSGIDWRAPGSVLGVSGLTGAIAWWYRRRKVTKPDGTIEETEEMDEVKFLTGARPTPRHKLAAATPFRETGPTPPQVIYVPPFLEPWLNDTYGICVTAEECFAKAAYTVMNGLPETKITDKTELAFANKYGVRDGADLTEVMDAMISDGFHQDGVDYKNGAYKSVDYSNESLLQNAIAQGPVKVGMASGGLPSGAGQKNGWYAFGSVRAGQQDHCIAYFGYGAASAMFAALGVTMPSSVSPTKIVYFAYTWRTIGIVDHDWIMAVTGETWIRNPTTVGVVPLPPPINPCPVGQHWDMVANKCVPDVPTPGTFTPPFQLYVGGDFVGSYPDQGTATAAAQAYANANTVSVDVKDKHGSLVVTVQPSGPIPLPGGDMITLTTRDAIAAGATLTLVQVSKETLTGLGGITPSEAIARYLSIKHFFQ